MAEVIQLSDRRPPPADDPFAEPHEVVRFDLDRRARPIVDRSSLDGLVERTADRIKVLEDQVDAMGKVNEQLLEVLVGLLTEVRGRRIAHVTAAIIGASNVEG